MTNMWKKKVFLAILLFAGWWTGVSGQEYVSEVWVSDNGDGTYTNPILYADYSDPDVCRVGDDYYMTASSFNCIPGLPILHSKDLVNWRLVNHALQKLVPADYFACTKHGEGIWAPSIRYHEGVFYIYWGDPDRGIYMVKSSDPLGRWDDPVLVVPGAGMIDATPLWDDDGRVYLVYGWARSRVGYNSLLHVIELDASGTKAIGNPVMVYDGNLVGNYTIEGPKFYKRNGSYYIFAPAGGVPAGWQVVMKADNVYGPYECRTVMASGQSDINGPHQGAWVDTPGGEDWFIHFQDLGPYGRVVHLNPMKWSENGFPVIGIDEDGDGCGEPVRKYRKPALPVQPIETPVESDEFDNIALGLQWQWHANYDYRFGYPTSLGYLRLVSHYLPANETNMWDVPNLLLQKFPAPQFVARTRLLFCPVVEGERSGLIVMGRDYAYIGVRKDGKEMVVECVTCTNAEKGTPEKCVELARLPLQTLDFEWTKRETAPIWLEVKVNNEGACRFAYSVDGRKYKPASDVLFPAREGKWIGAKVGLFSVVPEGKIRGWVDADWFRITKK